MAIMFLIQTTIKIQWIVSKAAPHPSVKLPKILYESLRTLTRQPTLQSSPSFLLQAGIHSYQEQLLEVQRWKYGSTTNMVQKSEMNFYKNPFKYTNTQQPPVNKRSLTSYSQKIICRFIQLLTQSIYFRSWNSELGMTAHLSCQCYGCKSVKQDVVISIVAEMSGGR